MWLLRPMERGQMARLCAALALGLVLCAGAQAALGWSRAQLAAGQAVCADTLRLHVRADSDSVLDQSLKLRVRDTVLALADRACPSADKAEALAWAAQNLPGIELAAQSTLAGLGAPCEVRAALVNMYFGAAQYPGAALPSGRYDALRLELGDADRTGKNWWCVLYPGLCRTACGGYAQRAENDLVCGEYIVRFRLVDWWQQRAAREDEPLLAL